MNIPNSPGEWELSADMSSMLRLGSGTERDVVGTTAVLLMQQAIPTTTENEEFHRTILGFLAGASAEALVDDQRAEQSMIILKDGLPLVPEGHPNKPVIAGGLAELYLGQFEELGNVEDLSNAIQYATQGVSLATDEHPSKAELLNTLGYCYQARFEHLRNIVDLDKAIACATQTIALPASENIGADHAVVLTTLGLLHQTRFEQLDEIEDIEKALDYWNQAILLVPDGFSEKPLWLGELGALHFRRFERLNDPADIDKTEQSPYNSANWVAGPYVNSIFLTT
ncbi:hypothetical protein FS749_010731 [Ceratobasidium sp. UAMH 11750]|nr:hypothetical protein FS749_010731 [Ceratobasidium sp. UAMH 11750]